MSLGGGVNLAREPRDGRTFEYLGEDPILAGTIAGQVVAGTQAQHVIGNMKHFAMNDRERDRHTLNVNIDKRAMRESDLLAFEIGLRNSQAGAVMCAYNGVNGEPFCESKYLLAKVLRKDMTWRPMRDTKTWHPLIGGLRRRFRSRGRISALGLRVRRDRVFCRPVRWHSQ
jgi:beta-glucosidase